MPRELTPKSQTSTRVPRRFPGRGHPRSDPPASCPDLPRPGSFARSRFGAIAPHLSRSRERAEGHPEVMVFENVPGRKGARNDTWHSDLTFTAEPPPFSILQRPLRSLRAGWRVLGDPFFLMACCGYRRRSISSTVRPVMRNHPRLERKVFLVNPGFGDMTKEESEPILKVAPCRGNGASQHLPASLEPAVYPYGTTVRSFNRPSTMTTTPRPAGCTARQPPATGPSDDTKDLGPDSFRSEPSCLSLSVPARC